MGAIVGGADGAMNQARPRYGGNWVMSGVPQFFKGASAGATGAAVGKATNEAFDFFNECFCKAE
jgi:hypothetical protein